MTLYIVDVVLLYYNILCFQGKFHNLLESL